MPVSTYEEVAVGRVLKGIETLLETEFSPQKVVLSRENPSGVRFIRIANLPAEFVARPAGGVVERYTVEVVTHVPETTSRRKRRDTSYSLAARAKRVLNDNTAYSPSGTYKWHDGHADGLEEEGDTVKFIYSALVAEVGL